MDDLSPEQRVDFLLMLLGAIALAAPAHTLHIPDALMRTARSRLLDITAIADPAPARGIVLASIEMPANVVYPHESS